LTEVFKGKPHLQAIKKEEAVLTRPHKRTNIKFQHVEELQNRISDTGSEVRG